MLTQVGPVIGGFMAFCTTWRWMFWSTSIFQAVMIAVAFPTFHETYAPTILARKAAQLRKDTEDRRYYAQHERLVAGKSLVSILTQALTRPLRLLVFHPVIQITSLISAIKYGILYIVLATFADLWTKQYGQSVEISGLHYIAIALGESSASQVGGLITDRYYHRKQRQHSNGELAPEHRISLTFPSVAIATVGFLIYAWTAAYRVHWFAVDVGIFIALFGMQFSGISMQAYTMDAYSQHTSSAMAATQFLRSLTAFLFPLFAPKVYEVMGYGWCNTMVALMTILFGASPVVLWIWGAEFRQRVRSTE